MDNRKISIAIPTFQRKEMVIEAFEQVHDDPRVDEVIIVDDASDIDVVKWLKDAELRFSKMDIWNKLNNEGCYQNKFRSVSYAKNEFICLWDSDNIFGTDYLDRIFEYEWEDKLILTPSFLAPHFDFRHYAGITLTKENISEHIDKPSLETLLNAANYFVPKKFYLSCYDKNVEPMTSDSLFMSYQFLKNGGKIHIVEGLTYQHRVHGNSHYQNNVHLTQKGFHEQLLQSLREMK
jgi:glycosyltransferase involved in cell wall biosynthesis